jgi:hypothetical protein
MGARNRVGVGLSYRPPEPEFVNLLTDNPFWRTGPPGFTDWRKRFLGSLKVYKFGLRLHRLAELVPWNRFLRSFKFKNSGSVHCIFVSGSRLFSAKNSCFIFYSFVLVLFYFTVIWHFYILYLSKFIPSFTDKSSKNVGERFSQSMCHSTKWTVQIAATRFYY